MAQRTSLPWSRRAWCSAMVGLSAGALGSLSGCAASPVAVAAPSHTLNDADRQALAAADYVLLGEQHDASEHHALEAACSEWLAKQGQLGALVLEMADAGSQTLGLETTAGEAQVRQALAWQNDAWPWEHYAPAIMAAVRAGVPVYGGNLPRSEMKAAMNNTALSERVPLGAWRELQRAVDEGHCGLLPERRWAPMARIQIAKDLSLARTLTQTHVRDRTSLLLCGSAHASRLLGVPLHLNPSQRTLSVHLRAANGAKAGTGAFDLEWVTAPTPERDYCAELKAQWGKH